MNELKQQLVQQAKEQLDANGVLYVSTNNDLHFILTTPKGRIDFWPTSGKFINREDNYVGNNLANLLVYLVIDE